MVWVFHNGKIPKGMHIHHIDEDRTNNNISNLEIITPAQHLKRHMTPERREKQKEWINKIRPLSKEWHSSEEGVKWHKKNGKKSWVGRKFLEKECPHCHESFRTRDYRSVARFCGQNCKAKSARRIKLGLAIDFPPLPVGVYKRT